MQLANFRHNAARAGLWHNLRLRGLQPRDRKSLLPSYYLNDERRKEKKALMFL
jgi:hypothetical protein